MVDTGLSKPYLESLSTGELIRLAENYGIDIPPQLDRVFIIGELLDAEEPQEDEEEIALPPSAFFNSVPLPKQYNITFIEVLIRDPLWAFVFWDLNIHDRELHEKSPDFVGYCLRVSPAASSKEEPFVIPLEPEDSARYIGFTPESRKSEDCSYRVEFCVLKGEEMVSLCVSPPFVMPRPHSFSGDAAGAEFSPLALLSGAGDFRMAQYVDRVSRRKQE